MSRVPDERPTVGDAGTSGPTLKRPRTRFLVRYLIPSDRHRFIGRLYELGIVRLSFDSYDDLAKHPDCKYAVDVMDSAQRLSRRVESLNLAGNMLWPDPFPENFTGMPVNQYDWLTILADVFLMRCVSVVDCAMLVIGEVYETGLARHQCTLQRLRKCGVSQRALATLECLLDDQKAQRPERNARVHHGEERSFALDDATFKVSSYFDHRGDGMVGRDQFDRVINVQRSSKEGLVGLQRTFNSSTRRLVRQLDRLYDVLGNEFEHRFRPRIAVATHGLNAKARSG